MSDYREMCDQLRIDRFRAEQIIGETRAAVALATEALAAANRALLSLSRALGERQGLWSVPSPDSEMAVWHTFSCVICKTHEMPFPCPHMIEKGRIG